MVRHCKRKIGAGSYKNYSTETLKLCLDLIKNGTLSQCAAKQFNIPRKTIISKLSQKHFIRPGKQSVFSRFEEELFVSYIEAIIDFGFPLTQIDLRFMVS